ncbi:hypothetical protein IIA79_05365, partial [bacterium]|nr:hypothetical protein [bacterium]
MTIEMAQIGGLRETERGELELIVAKLIETVEQVADDSGGMRRTEVRC